MDPAELGGARDPFDKLRVVLSEVEGRNARHMPVVLAVSNAELYSIKWPGGKACNFPPDKCSLGETEISDPAQTTHCSKTVFENWLSCAVDHPVPFI